MKLKYDVIYSLGGNCQCAMILSDCSLRITSGPFDWLCKASFKDRFTCLFDDFNDFLNPKNFVRITIGNEQCYDNIKANFRFWHDFRLNKAFTEEFPEFKAKYERRIDRFLNNIRNKKTLLIWLYHDINATDKEIKGLCDKFCNKIDQTVDFLIITDGKENKYNIAPNITRVLTPLSGEYTNKQEYKIIYKLFKSYKLNISTYRQIKNRCKFVLSKIICPLFFFSKKLKKKIKDKLRKI